MSSVQIPKLNGSRFVLRAFYKEEVEALHGILLNPKVLHYFPSNKPPSLDRVVKLIESQQAHWDEHGYGWWAVADSGSDDLIGWCGINHLPDTDEVELKYLLDEEYWGRGIATEAGLLSLQRWIADTEIKEIIGLVHPENIASRRVLEKVGMSFINNAQYFGMEVLRYIIQRDDFT